VEPGFAERAVAQVLLEYQPDNLRTIANFCRVYDAFVLAGQMSISTQALIQVTTNEPTGDTVRSLQAALRAQYDRRQLARRGPTDQ